MVADPGKSLIYLDYAQFEPGILAFLSRDERLTAAYNAGDVYTALSEQVFGSPEHRPIAKRIFLAFCYGMSIEALVGLLSGPQAEETIKRGYRDAIKSFFDTFDGLSAFRDQSAANLEINGYAASLLGNNRRRSRTGPLSNKERRWALNQPVQSTAALIFKEAVVELSRTFGMDAILLPMHDAALMQFSGEAPSKQDVSKAIAIMENAFTRRCPGIVPRITSGQFSS